MARGGFNAISAPIIEMTVFGDKELAKAFGLLPAVSQKKVIRPALREAAKEIRGPVADALPRVTGINTDPIRAYLRTAPVRSASKGSVIRFGTTPPDNADMAIAIRAIEYGSQSRGIQATRFQRETANREKPALVARIGKKIGAGIEKEWARLAAKK